MLKSEIENVIESQTASLGDDLGMRRDGLSEIPVQDRFATIITGVRRCGKSTLLRQWASSSGLSVLPVLFEDFRLMDFEPKDFALLGKIVEERRVQAVILDEVQDLKGWELFVNGLLGRKLKVFVTGSNAKMLSVELGTKLSGRHLDYRLDPFTYPEFLRFGKRRNTVRSLEEYLLRGGFPAYVASGNRQVLESLFGDIVYRDVVTRYRISNTQPIKQLAVYLLNHVGTRLAPSRLKDAIHVQSAKTVLEYFDHLTECCLIDRLEQWADSPKARMLAQKKVYACDTGLVTAFERIADANLGHKLENVVFRHLKRKGGDLTYYRAGDDSECDFLREAIDGRMEAIQVAYELNEDNVEREMRGLLAALKRFGLSRGTIVTAKRRDEAVADGCEIRIVPATEYLTEDFSG